MTMTDQITFQHAEGYHGDKSSFREYLLKTHFCHCKDRKKSFKILAPINLIWLVIELNRYLITSIAFWCRASNEGLVPKTII